MSVKSTILSEKYYLLGCDASKKYYLLGCDVSEKNYLLGCDVSEKYYILGCYVSEKYYLLGCDVMYSSTSLLTSFDIQDGIISVAVPKPS
jgi:hypothetical protein